MPGYVVRDSPLDAATVSTDALDPPTLGSVLSGAGFEAGTERRFTAPRKPLTLVVARVLLFRSADGAGAYLAWVRNHGTDLLGSQAQVTGPLDLPGAIAFSHDSCDFCAKDTFEYFAAWTHGPYALTLLVGGPRAGRPAATPLAEELDARVKKGG